MSRTRIGLAVLLALAVLAGAGCDSAKRSLGLVKTAPDEFQVVRNAPLSVPPDFGLRPPEPGAARPQEPSTTQQAETIVFGNALAADEPSPGAQALLERAGAVGADHNVRVQINEDNALLAGDTSFTDQLVFWRDPAEPGLIVDPDEEAERLSSNAAQGLPPTEGQTPVIEEREKAIFEDVF